MPVGDERGQVHLRDTIRVEVNKRTGGASVIAGDEKRDVNHAVFVELGTSDTDAQPYLRPAAELAVKRSRARRVRLYK